MMSTKLLRSFSRTTTLASIACSIPKTDDRDKGQTMMTSHDNVRAERAEEKILEVKPEF